MTDAPYGEGNRNNTEKAASEMEAATGRPARFRAITEADTPDILRWRNAPHVMAQFLRREPLTAAGHTAWLREQVFPGHAAQFIILEQATDRPVGSVYLQHIDPTNRKAEFGIFLGEPDSRGKGLGLAATQWMTAYAFDTLGLHKVYLRVLPENAAALRTYEKVGYTREGLFRDDVVVEGAYRDVVFMAVLKEERAVPAPLSEKG